MGEAQQVDDLTTFADLLDDAPAASGTGRAGKIALIVFLVLVLATLGAGGGYVWWASAVPLKAPVVTSEPPSVPASEPAAIRLPTTGSMLVSVSGGEAYLGPDASGAWVSSGGDEPRPIASIAKLVTALVVLDRHPLASPDDPGPTLTFGEADADLYDEFYVRGVTIARMPEGAQVSLHDALATMLLPSASNYAVAVARWGFGSESAYVNAARSWLDANGLSSTRIMDATGIDERNTSTPSDLLALGKIAAANPVVAAITGTSSISVPAGPGTVTNTNDLLGVEGIDGLKTGNLGEGSFNLLFTSDLDVGIGAPLRITGMRLGGTTHDSTDQDVVTLLQSIRAGFHEVPVGSVGAPIGEITTAWGSRADIILARGASLMTWSDTPVTATLDVRTPETYADGETVGTVTWTAGPHTTSAEVAISGAIEEPSLWWRLTHPGELG